MRGGPVRLCSRQCCVSDSVLREGLVCCGHFYVVDDENVDRAFGGFELEAELLLEGGEEIGRVVVVRGRSVVGSPLEIDVVHTGEAGFVDDVALDDEGEV